MGPTIRDAPDYTYIDSQHALDEFLPRLGRADRAALDIEANSLFRYHHRVCLIQLTIAAGDYIVDPLAELRLDGLLEILARKPLVLHAADYDLRMMRSSFGFEPREKVLDTMLAAQLLGQQNLGLQETLRRWLGIERDKKGQKSNWSQRPLTAEQLQYACEDTHHLLTLADRLAAELASMGRTAWHEEFCARVVQAAQEEPEGEDPDRWRIKGSATLPPAVLRYLRAIWEWRESEAAKLDRPPFKVLPNDLMLRLADWAAAHRGRPLAAGPRLPRNYTDGRLGSLETAIRAADKLPQHDWPHRKPAARRREEAPFRDRELVAQLQTACARAAEPLGISQGTLAPRSALIQVARVRPRTLAELREKTPLMQWQVAIVGPIILPILEQQPARRA